ncbi:hypothetical protein baBA2_000257 [Borrelia anserina]|nr:hypothetical protein [Borrelia anserina]APR64753.1 hypothetical protein N187_01280 [Borrelia anserina Es]UPA06668.1 hypothetical protein baBA2_000257 [Borrelia anserina]
MEINNSSEVLKVITQAAFRASEISSENIRKKKIKEDKNLSLNQGKSYHVDSEINSVYPTGDIIDGKLDFTMSKLKTSKRDLPKNDIKFSDPKIGRNVDVER